MTISQIHELANQVPRPKSYYAGVSSPLDVLPTKVLQFHRRKRQLDTEREIHSRFVLVACLLEPGGVIVDGEFLQLEPGHGLLILPFQSHHFTRFANPERLSWLFTTFEHPSSEVFTPLKNTPFTYSDLDLSRLQRLTHNFVAWSSRNEEEGLEAPIELALLLSGLIRRQHNYVRRAGGKAAQKVGQYRFVQRITRLIYDNLNEPIPIEFLAREMALSPSRLRAKFKECIGVSLGDFTRRTRIHKASGLLHSSEMSVSEIAEECGFESLYSFSRAFKQIVGEAPRYFRDRVRGERSSAE